MTKRFKVLTLNNIAQEGLARLPEKFYEVSAQADEPDAILVRSHNMHGMSLPDGLLAVGRAGAGVNNIPVAELTEKGVPVFNAPGANANAVKELVIAGMLLAARNLMDAWQYVRGIEGSDEEIAAAVEAGKKRYVGFELPGKTLGVIGLGAIGVEVANAALALGMRVVGYDPQITVRRAWQLSSGVEQAANLEDLFRRADIVTCHIPLIPETHHLINRDRLGLLRDGAIILNFARDGIVDDTAVVAALESGRVGTYVTDFPTPEIKDHDRIICLPHLGASTREAEQNCAVMVADNLRDFLENGNIRHSVNFPEAVLARTRPHRLALSNANVPNMVGQMSTALAEQNLNIADLLNVSRGGVAHTILDLDGPVNDATLGRIRAIDGILCVRVLPVPAEY
ncbi:MAG: 3-phosphoglycerate dehydrogenase family protein [Gammaproteobacteria bacterium]|nr:3-phosphoglycerate dehydrogenase family protein [Gammaproteobacteria bacterium]